jgi:hypothetical protein
MKYALFAAVSTLSLASAPAALAQDHSGHGTHQAAPMPAPTPPRGDYCIVGLEQPRQPGVVVGGGAAQQMVCTPEAQVPAVDHSTMDHSQMDHSQMHHDAMGHSAPAGPVEASGTARLPQAEGMMPGLHFDIGGGWMGMAHGYAWGIYTRQTGPRGDDKFHVDTMAMLMAEKDFGGARLQLRTMLSADPSMEARGYPNLFATGETAGGIPLVDRQHPHDLFMELAARFDVDVAPGTTAFLYGGPVGEPALGPPAFMHRASAKLNPEAPITHHWLDSTHITYGVITAGVAGRTWQIEGSAFRGEEPDEDRWGIETPRFDSWSARVTLNPSPNWALQVSHGRLKQPELTHPGQDEARTTASVHYNSGTGIAATAAFSNKDRLPGPARTAWLLEANWDLARGHTLFGRFENAENDELFPDHAHPLHDQPFRVSKLQAGYAYTVPLGDVAALSLGGSAAKFFKPEALDLFYGDDPMGYTLFAKLTLGR